MKLVCVSCDEKMKLEENRGPDEGSLSMTFACPKCGQKTNILTNPMETQMVKSLGVEVCPAGEQSAPEPMGLLRESLSSSRPDALAPQEGSPVEDLPWSTDARERLDRVPSFIRPMVKKSIAKYAVGKGYGEVNGKVMDEAKGSMETYGQGGS